MELIFWCQNPTGCRNRLAFNSFAFANVSYCKRKNGMDVFDLMQEVTCVSWSVQNQDHSQSAQTKWFLLKNKWSRLAEHTGEKVEHQVFFQPGAALLPFNMRPWKRIHSYDSLKVWYVFRNAGQPACHKPIYEQHGSVPAENWKLDLFLPKHLGTGNCLWKCWFESLQPTY